MRKKNQVRYEMELLSHSGENKEISKMHVCCLLVPCFSFSFCGTSEQCLSPFLTQALALSDERKEPIGSQQEIVIFYYQLCLWAYCDS